MAMSIVRTLSRHPASTTIPIVIIATVVPYLPVLNTYFVGDDFGLIKLFSAQSPLHFLTLFTTSWVGTTYGHVLDEIRPFVAPSYQVDSLWGAANPVGYHVTNLIIHCTNCVLVLWLARGVCHLVWPSSVFTGVLFGTLPIHVSSVAWISGRADTIPALFSVAGLLSFAHWRLTERRSWYVAAGASDRRKF